MKPRNMAELKTLPPYEQTHAEALEVVDQVTKAAHAAEPELVWDPQPLDVSSYGCADFRDADKNVWTVSFMTSASAAVPPERWGKLMAAIADAAAPYGFHPGETVGDSAQHATFLRGPHGAHLLIDAETATAIQVHFGCRVRNDAHATTP